MAMISRRNFINGTLMAAGSTLFSSSCTRNASEAVMSMDYYPPTRTGLRGSHPGSHTHVHAKAWSGKSNWGPTTHLSVIYDLIVVGGGISGLSAAYFYRQKRGRNIKILILDNHDDFGGHAKRNEHIIDENMRITYGGSQSLVNPNHASKIIQDLFTDIGIDVERFHTAYDDNFYRNNN